ncbi:glycoside hydrolase family 3 protein [Novosphingobium sp.]|uniref:glycoside hydrolase family 3 protein n=1 Tax=Novosphingobium sp. TaxID=1874826 RepID=UPI0025E952A0|nr:glycoside hydrolase family 3 protein [Novosphingobium sp.]MCC6926539.1 glycoside hydrolase family 3 protein [Novosphingobium sp.]
MMQFGNGRVVLVKFKYVLAAGALATVLAGAASGKIANPAGWSADEAKAIAAWPARKATGKIDPAIEIRIAKIVKGMTLEQKIGQITQPSILSITPDQVRKHYIGTILNGGGAWPAMNKHASVKDWANLADQFAKAAMSTDMKVKIPLIWGIDAVHGNNNVHGATIFPHNIGLGATRDPNLVYRIGRATAKQVRATGLGWAFAPTLAVVQNQRWGRAYEGYSSDPAQVALLGTALVRGLQGTLKGDGDVLASAKHYLGDGGTLNGVDQGETRTSARDLVNVHGRGYYSTLDANVQTVMISYSSWTMDGVPFGKMHGNRALIDGVLKRKLNFDGIVVSDWNAIEQVPGCKVDHCPAAINAGIDVFMVPEKWESFIANTVADVKEGRVPMARIDDAVTRILRVKFRTGLFDRPISAGRFTGQASALENRALAQEAVRKSAVLLKNDKATLPLKPGKRVLVVGAAADSFPMQAGGWSVTWQGDEINNGDFPTGETVLTGLRRVYGAGNVTFSADGSAFAPGKFDAVIAVIAESPHAEMKGDVRWPAPIGQSLQYPADLALLDKVGGKGVPLVTLLYSGRTTYTTDLINRSDAFVAAFLPGSEAGALADLFAATRGYDFTGRLSFAWPSTTCPTNGYPAAEQLFARGFGLSYAKARQTGHLVESANLTACP